MNSVYDYAYIFTNILSTYTIYKLMHVFFDSKEADKKYERPSYYLYFIFMTTMYFIANIPVIMLISNISAFLLISFNYRTTIKKRILSVVFIYAILMCIEIIIALLSGNFSTSIIITNDYSNAYGLIAVRIMSYVVALILSKNKNVRQGEIVSVTYWMCIVLIPISSLYIILIIFLSQGLSRLQITISMGLILGLNFTTFYLYDAIISALSNKAEQMMISQQNKYYDNQLNLMKESIAGTKALRHDFNNHISTIYALAESDEKEKLRLHLSEIINTDRDKTRYVSTGDMAIDSIINFKIQEAMQKDIKITHEIMVPESMNIPSFDMTIILGNLLDNAIRAADNEEENKYIDIKAWYSKGRLFFKIENTYSGKIVKENNKFATTKLDKENHGIGLENVRKALNKYDGNMNIEYKNNIFSVLILMYIELM